MRTASGSGHIRALALLAVAVLSTVTLSAADPRQWPATGLPIRQGAHLMRFHEAATQDQAGNMLVAWADMHAGDWNVYAQRTNSNGLAQWPAGGVRVSPVGAIQANPAVAAVQGGFMIAWIDYRDPMCSRIWIQKLDASGNPLWTANPGGVAVADLPLNNWEEGIVSVADDGAGGAYLVWERDLTYVQRVQSDGAVTWPAPVTLNPYPVYSTPCSITSDGNGNLLLARRISALPLVAVSVSKISPDGESLWGTDGMIVSAADSSLADIQVCSDRGGGCFVGWQNRAHVLLLQRLNSNGSVLWNPLGVVLCSAVRRRSGLSLACSEAAGTADGVLASWSDQRDTPVADSWNRVYVQKFDLDAQPIWSANGIPLQTVNSEIHTQESSTAASDHAGGLVCTWSDLDISSWQGDLRASRLSSAGIALWGADGRIIGETAMSSGKSAIRAVNSSGALVAWESMDDSSAVVRIQHLNLSDGQGTLDPSGVALGGGTVGDVETPQALSMGQGRVAIVFKEYSSRGACWLRYQIVDADGSLERSADRTRLAPDNEGYSTTKQQSPSLCSDGAGGFFTAFQDQRTDYLRVRVQRINAAGEIAGPLASVPVQDDPAVRDQVYQFCAPDGEGGCFVAWTGYLPGDYHTDLYVMRMNAACQAVWNAPLRLTDTYDDDLVCGLVPSLNGSCIVAWSMNGGSNKDVWAAQINRDGSVNWSTDVCNAPEAQTDVVVIEDGQGGACLAWTDGRGGSAHGDVYAQRFSAAGTPLWTTNGVAVIPVPNNQVKPAICTASDGGLLVEWRESQGHGFDLYAQKLDPQGTLLWDTRGVPVCMALGDQLDPVIKPDRFGGLISVWTDNRSYPGASLYGTHLNAEGQPAWDPYWLPDSGNVICSRSIEDESQPALVEDGLNGYVAVWRRGIWYAEGRTCDLYAQRILDSSAPVTSTSTVIPSAYALYQNYPNPFNPTTEISYVLPKSGNVTLRVFDILGREVATLMNGRAEAGDHTVSFNAANLSSGVYIYRVESGSFRASRKMVVLK